MDLVHDEPNYMAIFWWLFALTVIEVAITYMPVPKSLMVTALVVLAFTKASLVAMYFMHLRFEKRTLGVVALTPPILLIMFVFIIYPDTAWRLFQHWTGH
jgi:cytochrome c oxidase subunit 4